MLCWGDLLSSLSQATAYTLFHGLLGFTVEIGGTNCLVLPEQGRPSLPLYLQEAFEDPTLQRAPPLLTGT